VLRQCLEIGPTPERLDEFSVSEPPIYERLVPLADGRHERNVGIADESEVFLSGQPRRAALRRQRPLLQARRRGA
jgi:hypothetical protein